MSPAAFPFSAKEIAFCACVVVAAFALNVGVGFCEEFLHLHFFDLRLPWHAHCWAFMEAFAMGALLAQVAVLAVWSAMFQGSLLIRNTIATFVLVTQALLLLTIFESLIPEVLGFRESWARGISWPVWLILLYAIQIPLLAVRKLLGYVVMYRSRVADSARVGQMSLRDMFGLMTFVSLPLFLIATLDSSSAFVRTTAIFTFFCVLFAMVHLWAFLRPCLRLTPIAVLLVSTPLMVWCTLGSLVGLWGDIQGVPLTLLVPSLSLGIYVVGIPIALAARVVGYRVTKPSHSGNRSERAAQCEPTHQQAGAE